MRIGEVKLCPILIGLSLQVGWLRGSATNGTLVTFDFEAGILGAMRRRLYRLPISAALKLPQSAQDKAADSTDGNAHTAKDLLTISVQL